MLKSIYASAIHMTFKLYVTKYVFFLATNYYLPVNFIVVLSFFIESDKNAFILLNRQMKRLSHIINIYKKSNEIILFD